MKPVILTLLFFMYLLLAPSCKKDNVSPEKEQSPFPLNTQWTGTMHQTSEEYYEPCYLRINKDKTIKIYAFFYYYNIENNNVEHKDSLSGTVKSIDTANGKMNVVININGYPDITGDQTLIITNKKTLRCNGAFSSFALFLNKFSNKNVSVEGKWSGPVMHGRYEARHAYPDLQDIVFNADGTTTYWREGNLAYHGVPQASDYYIIKASYKQTGPMVRMSGYNETNQKFIPYFGVFLASGDTLLVSSRDFINGRLPSKINGNYQEGPYGTSGYTPMIIRK